MAASATGLVEVAEGRGVCATTRVAVGEAVFVGTGVHVLGHKVGVGVHVGTGVGVLGRVVAVGVDVGRGVDVLGQVAVHVAALDRVTSSLGPGLAVPMATAGPLVRCAQLQVSSTIAGTESSRTR